MVTKKIALQLYTVRDDMQKDFLGTVKKVSEMGYDGVEFAGFYGYTPEKAAELLKENNLEIAACHIAAEDLENNIDSTIDLYKRVGCKNLVISYSDENRRPGGAKFEETLSLYKSAGKKLKENGLNLFYHNHDFEFTDYKGVCGFDYMFDNVSSEYLNPEIDLCWVNIAGRDPIKYIEKYSDRCKLLHFKDFIRTDGGYEFKPLGQGVQDMKRLVEAAEKSVAEWYVVEQDYSSDMPAIKAAEMSIDFLKSIR